MVVLPKEIPQDNPAWDKLTNQIVRVLQQYVFAIDDEITWRNLDHDIESLRRQYAIMREIPMVQGRGVKYFTVKAIFPDVEITYQCIDGGEDIVLNVNTH